MVHSASTPSPTPAMAKAVTAWRSEKLGWAAFLLDSLFVAMLFCLPVILFGGIACAVPVLCLALTGVGGARLMRAIDRGRTRSSRIWTLLIASVWTASVLVLASLQGPPVPQVGEDVSSVLQRLGTPFRDSRTGPGREASTEYTLSFWVVDFSQPLIYEVHVTDGRVAGTRVRSYH